MYTPSQHRSWIFALHGRVPVFCALALAILLGPAVVAVPSAQAQSFTTFDAPGAGTGALQGTIGLSINAEGDVTGGYVTTGTVTHGFVRVANGTITGFDVPAAGAGKNQGTFPIGINASGTIAGMYSDGSTLYHGFVRTAAGTIATFNVPGSFANFDDGNTPMSIDAAGDVAGFYRDTNLVYHSFLRAASGTITSPIDAAGAGTGLYQGTEAICINATGVIAGFYVDANYIHHGFLRAANGTVTTFDVSGASTSGTFKNLVGTVPLSIDAAGDIVGTYTDTSGARHAFVRMVNGTITTFDAPGAATGTGLLQGTVALSINDAGAIAGAYADANSLVHGFVRTAGGAINVFSAPGATAGVLLGGTAALGINAAGAVTGSYTDTSMVFHGFVLSPLAPTVTVMPSAPSITTAQALTVTVTVAVAGSSGNPTPTGTVTLSGGGFTSVATMLNSGSTMITIPAGSLAVGADTLTGAYSGDSSYTTASGTGSVTVTLLTPTVTVTPASSSITTAQALSIAVAVNGGSGNPTPTGTVTLSGGGYTSAATTLSGGSASINIPAGSLAGGIDTLTASYSGDHNYTAATGANPVTVTPFSVGGTAVTVSPGRSIASTITVTPIGGFTGSVALTAAVTSSPSGAQDPPTFSFGTTSPVNITGASPATATLTITTTAATTGALAYPPLPRVRWYAASGTVLAFALLFAIPARGRSWRTRLGLLLIVMTLIVGLPACGGSSGGGGNSGGNASNPGTTPGAYTVTVSAASGNAKATGTVTLTVQ